jgi:hypothetical protein
MKRKYSKKRYSSKRKYSKKIYSKRKYSKKRYSSKRKYSKKIYNKQKGGDFQVRDYVSVRDLEALNASLLCDRAHPNDEENHKDCMEASQIIYDKTPGKWT